MPSHKGYVIINALPTRSDPARPVKRVPNPSQSHFHLPQFLSRVFVDLLHCCQTSQCPLDVQKHLMPAGVWRRKPFRTTQRAGVTSGVAAAHVVLQAVATEYMRTVAPVLDLHGVLVFVFR